MKILGIYSVLVLVILILVGIKEIIKGKEKSQLWSMLVVIPILLYCILNLVGGW